MITKKVNRYYCEFCNKSGGAAGHIKSHELHCTKNPNRECRMCKFLDKKQSSLSKLINLLPNIEDYKTTKGDGYLEYVSYGSLQEDLDKILHKLRKASEDCPCCILSAIRQAEIPVYLVKNFHFKEECQEIFNVKNAGHDESYY